jgi:septum formation protein
MPGAPRLCAARRRRAARPPAAGVAFESGRPPEVDETPPAGVAPAEVAQALAVRKARAAASRAPGRVVVTADTTVLLGDAILSKPEDAADARRMLHALSGRVHRVVTGVAVARDATVLSASDATSVEFRPLSDEEIAAYVATGEPLDKAGAYAIQGGAAGFVVRREGRLDTVVGLPVDVVRRLVAEIGIAG